jgi:hypothetical protein
MLKSLTIAIALLAVPVATSFTGLDSTAYAQAAGGGGNGGGGGSAGGGGGNESVRAAVARVPNSTYEKPRLQDGPGCPTPTEGRYGPKRFIGSCGPY